MKKSFRKKVEQQPLVIGSCLISGEKRSDASKGSMKEAQSGSSRVRAKEDIKERVRKGF
jgi:hypothetical protein